MRDRSMLQGIFSEAQLAAGAASVFGLTGGGDLDAISRAAFIKTMAEIGVVGRATGRMGLLLDDFKTGWKTYGGVDLAQSPNALVGNSSAVFNPTSNYDGPHRTYGTTFAIQSGVPITLVFWVPDAMIDGICNITLQFSSDAGATKTLSINALNPNFRSGNWVVYSVIAGETGTTEFAGQGWVAAGGQAWGDAFNWMNIIFNSNAFANGCLLNHLYIGQRAPARAIFTFDGLGNNNSVLNVAAPMLAGYGWQAGVDMDGNNLVAGLAQYLALQTTYGWDVGTQGMNHTNYANNPNSLAADLVTANALHVANGLSNPPYFAYPFNASTTVTDKALNAAGYIKWARSGGMDILHPQGVGAYPNNNGNLLKQGYVVPFGGNDWTNTKNRIDALLQSGGVLSFFTHGVGVTTADTTLGVDVAMFARVLDYLAANNVQVIKPSQIWGELAGDTWY